MRDHFDGTAGAGPGCERLHVFSSFQGDQASHDTYRHRRTYRRDHWHWRNSLLYKFTYGHPELRIPGMAIALFLGMCLSRIFVLGPLGFLIGFVVAVSQSVGEAVPSPELLVRGLLWLWVALVYGAALTVVLNLLFLPDTTEHACTSAETERVCLSPDAFTNPAHVHFALKVTFAAMFCYIVYEAIDWSGIHTAFITCTSSRWKALRRRSTKELCESSVA